MSARIRLSAAALAALLAAPGPAAAQTVRVALKTPLGSPAFVSPTAAALTSPSLSAPALSVAGSLSAITPVLPAPAITGPSLTAIGRGTSSPYGSVVAAKTFDAAPAALATAVIPAAAVAEKPGETIKADADVQFDGSTAKDEIVPVAAEPVVVETPRLEIPDLDHKISRLGRVPAPRPWIEKGKVLLTYGGLTASAVALHAPFDHIERLVIALVLGAMMAPVMAMFMLAGQSARSDEPATVPPGPSANDEAMALAQTEAPRPSAASMALIARLAVEAKVPPPERVNILPGKKVQAQVGGGDDKNPGYEMRFTKSFEELRPDVQEAIIRHEYAHRRHHDGAWSVVTMFLTTTPLMVALLGAAEKPALIGWLAGAIAATSLLLFPVSLQHSEYMADQYAASKPEGAGPLARFFIEDSEKPERAVSALTGREFSSETGWKRRAIMFWDSLMRVFSAHPSHDRRIARLVRLSDKEKSR